MAYRVVREALVPIDLPEFPDRLNYAYELTLGRRPTAAERTRLAKYFDQQMTAFGKSPQQAKAIYPAPLQGEDPAEAAAWVGVSRVLLNLDEFITRE